MTKIFRQARPAQKAFGKRVDHEQDAIKSLRAAIAVNDVTAIAAARRQLDRILD